jgi:hypothetical protein
VTDNADQMIHEYGFETVKLEAIDDILYDLDQAPSGA